MIMTNGLGATIGTLAAMAVVNHYVDASATPEEQLAGWRICWYIFAGYAAAVAVLFTLFFHDKTTRSTLKQIEKAEADPAFANEI